MWLRVTTLPTGKLKQERPVLMVSHDLREIAPHVTHAWRMLPGGVLESSDVGPLSAPLSS